MLNTTMRREDLKEPTLARTLCQIQNTAFSLFWQATPFSVDGLLRHRWRINRWFDQWRFTKAVAHVPWERSWNIIDIGSAASLPVYHLALEGCTITTIDDDPELAEVTRKFSEDKSLSLAVLETSLIHHNTHETAEADWVLCISQLEKYNLQDQKQICKKIASLLKNGGNLTIIFQYGEEATYPHAPHSIEAIEQWVHATGMRYFNGERFTDRGGRYPIDGRQPER
jgi:hypothetical protein